MFCLVRVDNYWKLLSCCCADEQADLACKRHISLCQHPVKTKAANLITSQEDYLPRESSHALDSTRVKEESVTAEQGVFLELGLSLDLSAAGTGDVLLGQMPGTILPVDKSSQGLVQGTSFPVQCPECGQVLSQARNLKRHYQVCHQATLFPCDLCSCTYNRYDNLQKHIRDKHGIGVKLACPTCRRSFRSRAALEKHVVVCYSMEIIE